MYKIIRRIDSNFNECIQLPKLNMDDAKAYYTNLWKDTAEQHKQKRQLEENENENKNEEIGYTDLEEALKKMQKLD